MSSLRVEDVAADETSSLLHRKSPDLKFELDQAEIHGNPRSTLAKGWHSIVAAVTARLPQTLLTISRLPGIVVAALTLGAGIFWLLVATVTWRASSDNIRVVLLADAHLIGPQYECCSESNDVDNDSIMKTVDRLKAAQQQIGALSPAPAAVVFLGDVIHNGYFSHDFDWYLETRNAYTVGGEIFGGFNAPVRYLWGNHDYHTTCGNATASYERFSLSHRLFKYFLGPNATPYGSMQAGRYTLLFLNAMLGPSWDPDHERCDTRQASLGGLQLKWLDEELSRGRPTFVFIHHPLPAAMRSEAPELRHPDLLSVLLVHSAIIMAVFTGHYHRGLDWGDAYPFPHLTLPSCRYDNDNWFVLNLPQSGPVRSWRLLDWAKNKGGARCSETWTYPENKEPGPAEPQSEERGTCGRPTLEQVGHLELPPLQKVDDVPGPTGQQFNPAQPCSLAYQSAFLDLCLREGPTAGCCDILGEHLRASSAAYGASCMCWPPFWQQAQQTFRSRGGNATEVLLTCAAGHGKALQWPGRPGGSCMLPGSKEMPPPVAKE